MKKRNYAELYLGIYDFNRGCVWCFYRKNGRSDKRSPLILQEMQYLKEASAGDTTTQDTTTQNTTAPSEKDDVPKTEDNTPIAWLFMIVVISGAGVCYFGKKKKI